MSLKRVHSYEIITSRAELNALAAVLQKHSIFGVDLEADSLYHFNEKVCLVQIAAGNSIVIIDALKVKDLSPLKPLFGSSAIQKVFHGADYDIRSLYRDFQIRVKNLFDTQLACRFLGMAETGLEAVLKRWFFVHLNKKYQRKDWSMRPLPAEMMDYAAKDVSYLIPLASKLKTRLTKKGCLSWVLEECDNISAVRPASTSVDPLYLSFKGAGNLDSRSLAVLENVLQLRKKIAQKRNKPLFKIMRTSAVLNLALQKPRSLKALGALNILSPNQIRLYGHDMLAAIQPAVKLPEHDLPVYPRKKIPRMLPEVGKRVNALKIWRQSQAEKLKIDPALVLTNTLIRSLAIQNPLHLNELSKIKEMKKWQMEAFGRAITATLNRVTLDT